MSQKSTECASQPPSLGDIADQTHEAVIERPVEVWDKTPKTETKDLLTIETAVALVYNEVSHAVMMASPIELEEFALGFSLSEGIVSSADEIYEITTKRLDQGIEVSLTISNQCFARLKERRRSLLGRTGCGICGAESLQQIRPPVKKVVSDFFLSHNAIDQATRSLADHQVLQALTGAFHGAAWCDTAGSIVQVCEDIGRHNALDKLIGKLHLTSQLERGEKGFLLISSRASYEILQKSAMANFGFVVAMSAPTSMAIDIAIRTDITLVGFARHDRHVCYTNADRLF